MCATAALAFNLLKMNIVWMGTIENSSLSYFSCINTHYNGKSVLFINNKKARSVWEQANWLLLTNAYAAFSESCYWSVIERVEYVGLFRWLSMANGDDLRMNIAGFIVSNWKFNKEKRINIIENGFPFDCVGKQPRASCAMEKGVSNTHARTHSGTQMPTANFNAVK